MAATYRVVFNDGFSLYIYAADAKSMKRKHLTAALVNARKRAEAKRRKTHPDARATRVNCVG